MNYSDPIILENSKFRFGLNDSINITDTSIETFLKSIGDNEIIVDGNMSFFRTIIASNYNTSITVNKEGLLSSKNYIPIDCRGHLNLINYGSIEGLVAINKNGGIIDNKGIIRSPYITSIAIHINSSVEQKIVNSGEINTSNNISLPAIGIDSGYLPGEYAVQIINSGSIIGGYNGIQVYDANLYANIDLYNSGTIKGQEYSYRAFPDGIDKITNSGVMLGSIKMAYGDDVYISIGAGSVQGLVDGGAGDDKITGSDANDSFLGGDGNDYLRGGAGNDLLDGGTGSDTADYADSLSAVTVDLGIKVAQDTKGAGSDTLTSIENLTGSSYADTLTGNGLANVLAGGDGGDVLKGNAGSDTLDGGTGADRMFGGSGNDTYYVESAADRVYETATSASTDATDLGGTDTVSSSIGYALGKFLENLTLTGSANLGGVGNELANTLIGNDGANTLNGLLGADIIRGGAGNDKIDGGVGTDRMFGGSGNDTYFVENAGDRVYETATSASTDTTDLGGTDTVSSSISLTLGKFLENLTFTGTGNFSGTGNELANTLLGNEGANTLKGLAGNDTLKGGAGTDKLYGGDGNDMLTGGAGKDTFIFDTAPTSRDMITDFSRSDGDKIQLSKAVFKAFAYTGTLHADDFYAAAGATKAHDATDRLIYNTTTGVLYYDADGLGGAAAGQVAVLGASTHPALAYGDLQIIA